MNAGFLADRSTCTCPPKILERAGLERPGIKTGNGVGDFFVLWNARAPMHREGAEQFNRKSLNEISSITDLFHVLEAVRLAPSAMNKQPWYFSGTAEDVVVSRKSRCCWAT